VPASSWRPYARTASIALKTNQGGSGASGLFHTGDGGKLQNFFKKSEPKVK
jgi:hypothetical protein